jgi:hypothetical protein
MEFMVTMGLYLSVSRVSFLFALSMLRTAAVTECFVVSLRDFSDFFRFWFGMLVVIGHRQSLFFGLFVHYAWFLPY